jgi:hypothetical protein
MEETYPLTETQWGDLQVFLGKLGGIGEFLSNVDPGEFCDSRQLFFDLGNIVHRSVCECTKILDASEKEGANPGTEEATAEA